MKYTLPNEVLKLINNYLDLSIGSYKISCPYFQNSSLKSFRPVNIGKGLPEDIERVANKLIINIKQPTKDLILKRMIDNHLGIDCSGLTMRILDLLLKIKLHIDIRQAIKPSKIGLLRFIRHYLRTYTNLSANTLTSKINCIPVSLNNVSPGDLIRAGTEHVGIIFEVTKIKEIVTNIKYIHSIDGGNNIGVIVGTISVTNISLPVEKQKWEEADGKTHMLDEILDTNLTDSGIRRLKILSI